MRAFFARAAATCRRPMTGILVSVTALPCAAGQVELVFDFAESAHEIDCPPPLSPPCNFMQSFQVEAEGVVSPDGFAWDLAVTTMSNSSASELRVDVTAPGGHTVTLAGDADFGFPDAPGTFAGKGMIDGFDGESVQGTWTFLFYESVDDALNGADAIYEPGMTYTIDLGPTLPGDLDGDGIVGTADLLTLLAAWGTDGPGADLAPPDDVVGTADLLVLLANWT